MRTFRMMLITASLVLAGLTAAAAERPARARASRPAGADVDRREANQDKRIDQGIKKGYLTADESAKLEAEQKSIADLEAACKSDGKLTRDEAKQLRTKLNEASVHIWAEKHDTEGNQMPTYRLGKNVFAKSDITTALEQDDLTGPQARAILKDFHETLRLKRVLANENLPERRRTALQTKYNELLNKYFEVRGAAATATTPAAAK